MVISKIQNANRYKSLHGGGYQIGVGINKTSITHHIGYARHKKRYCEQQIAHEPTASDERTNNYGLTEQHQVNFFRIRWTTMCAWTTTDRIGWNKQITLSKRWQILWLTNEGIRFTFLNLIYKREFSDYVNWNQRWESRKPTTSDLESEQVNLA